MSGQDKSHKFNLQSNIWIVTVVEMLVANEEQANPSIRKSRLIEIIFVFI